MLRKKVFYLCVILGVLVLAACAPKQVTPAPTPTSNANLANPASVNCEKVGGKVEFQQDASGGTKGVCTFPDGSQCDEWALYRGECKAGDSLKTVEPTTAPGSASIANPASVNCEQQGGKLELKQDASGSSAGMCTFTDGSQCEEWAFFRGECKVGDSLKTAQ